MKAIEFSTTITNNQIQLPASVQAQLQGSGNQKIRVMLLLDDPEGEEADTTFLKVTQQQFLKGYANTDAIYDQE